MRPEEPTPYLPSRRRRPEKALKIEKILGEHLGRGLDGYTILDIGCGSGEIASILAEKNSVCCVDTDAEKEVNGATYARVESEILPFGDAHFDIVISNHVIEHLPSPLTHLTEMARVLKPGGVAYLATPNRLFPFEFHSRLPLVHYLPHQAQYRLLKRYGKFRGYLRLSSLFNLRRLAASAGFAINDYTHRILADPRAYHMAPAFTGLMGPGFWKPLVWLSPTFVLVLAKEAGPA